MLAGLKMGNKTSTQKAKTFFVEWKCPICGKILKLKPWQTKNKRTCSSNCSKKFSKTPKNIEMLRKIGKEKSEQNIAVKKQISEFILDWAMKNKEAILQCKYNNISYGLSSLMNELYDKYQIKDIRSYYICFDVKNKKEFLKVLKDYVINENIC